MTDTEWLATVKRSIAEHPLTDFETKRLLDYVDALNSRLDIANETIAMMEVRSTFDESETLQEVRDTATSDALRSAADAASKPDRELCECRNPRHGTDCHFSIRERILALNPASVRLDARQRELEVRHAGKLDGIIRYAWWKDGTQQVGSCGTTLKEAITVLDGELTAAISALEKEREALK